MKGKPQILCTIFPWCWSVAVLCVLEPWYLPDVPAGLLGETRCTEFQVCLPGWSCTAPFQGAGLSVSCSRLLYVALFPEGFLSCFRDENKNGGVPISSPRAERSGPQLASLAQIHISNLICYYFLSFSLSFIYMNFPCSLTHFHSPRPLPL